MVARASQNRPCPYRCVVYISSYANDPSGLSQLEHFLTRHGYIRAPVRIVTCSPPNPTLIMVRTACRTQKTGNRRLLRSEEDHMNPKKQKLKDRRRACKLADEAWQAANHGKFDLAEKIIRRAVAAQEDN